MGVLASHAQLVRRDQMVERLHEAHAGAILKTCWGECRDIIFISSQHFSREKLMGLYDHLIELLVKYWKALLLLFGFSETFSETLTADSEGWEGYCLVQRI